MNAKAQEQFCFKLTPGYKDKFENIHDVLGCKKYRLIEASIELFETLPAIGQLILISHQDEERRKLLDKVKEIWL